MRALAVIAAILLVSTTHAAEWDPAAFAKENTLELRTAASGEGEHWSPVWLVVVDDQVYVRLGSRAAERIETNTAKPYVGVRLAGQQFDRVKGEAAPDKAGAVGAAMGEKYWSDVLIRHFSHPLTLRLVPEQSAETPR